MKDSHSLIVAILICAGVFTAAYLIDGAFGRAALWLFIFPFLISLVSGLLRALIFSRFDTLRFAILIFKSNFHFEWGQNNTHGLKVILSRLLWEQPQTMLGNIGLQALNAVWLIRRVDYWKDTMVCQGSFINGGGIAFGSLMMVDLLSNPTVDILPIDDRTVAERILIRHEYGHYLQSKASGPLFIFKYGIPSIITQGWTEKDADFRSDKDLLINEKIMPVFSNHRNLSSPSNPGWWEYILVLAFIAGGYITNQLHGAIGGLLISSIAIVAINLKRPA